jgi:alkyl sulfatase BDS1-like metallo-beta-lactamase superfamily hydrolase
MWTEVQSSVASHAAASFVNAAAAATLLIIGNAAWADPATPATVTANAQFLHSLPIDDKRDFDDAHRGFMATIPDATVKADDGRIVWSLKDYSFLDTESAPATVNPSLWRQARLNTIHGLFKVTDRVYQVRGFDEANITFVEGTKGLIIVDTLTSVETARAALALYYSQRPHLPIVAIIYTHTHADHFGGVKGLVDEADVRAGKVAVIAPAGFMLEAVSENVLAGPAMRRRATFQFGVLLPKGAEGDVDAGLGKAGFGGTNSLIAPTDSIAKDIDHRTIADVDIEFRLTPHSEAPAEMFLYFPQFKALDLAEDATHTMHNLLPLRGAQVRDANQWAKYLDGALASYGDKTEVAFAQHHWPTWGASNVHAYLTKQRDLYKYTHDQTVRLMNFGYTPNEIAEQLRLPSTLSQEPSVRGLYGTLSHNSKAVYQSYLGWYDGNPAHLNPLPPVESARKLVEYMGGSAAVMAKAQADFSAGQYRWVAQVMNEVVFAEPDNRDVRLMQAAALEQLGYQAESASWRTAYLEAANELRNGAPAGRAAISPPDVVTALSMEQIIDSLAVRVDGDKADGKTIRLRWRFTDTHETYMLNLEDAALTALAGERPGTVDATLTSTRTTLNAILLKKTTFADAFSSGAVAVDGSRSKVVELFGTLDELPSTFPVVTPKPAAH